jgi:RimJ/RimL family protein N-acetyltransferase
MDSTTLFHERTTGQPIGWGGLQYSTIGIGECLTVGYVIAPVAWRRGYATEIATASVGHAFDELSARQLYASVLSTNDASRRVLDKAGLRVHREIDHGGHIEVIYLAAR